MEGFLAFLGAFCLPVLLAWRSSMVWRTCASVCSMFQANVRLRICSCIGWFTLGKPVPNTPNWHDGRPRNGQGWLKPGSINVNMPVPWSVWECVNFGRGANRAQLEEHTYISNPIGEGCFPITISPQGSNSNYPTFRFAAWGGPGFSVGRAPTPKVGTDPPPKPSTHERVWRSRSRWELHTSKQADPHAGRAEQADPRPRAVSPSSPYLRRYDWIPGDFMIRNIYQRLDGF